MNSVDFGIGLVELKELMQLKAADAKYKLDQTYNGTQGLSYLLATNLQTGIPDTKGEIQIRTHQFGRNEIKAKKSKSLLTLAFEAVQDTTLIMLIICAIISIGLSFYHPEEDTLDEEYRRPEDKINTNLEWVEGVAIMIAVVVVVGVTAFNDWRKERQFRGLQDQIAHDHMASVIRGGAVKQICVNDLVVGDICLIRYGDLVPTDGIITQASDLMIDESSLTGETDLIRKDLVNNITVLSGTHVMEGSGQYLVTAVGLHSQTGIIMSLLGAAKEVEVEAEAEKDGKKMKKKKKVKSKKHRSVLQVKLGKLALQIGYGGMMAALFTFIILCVRMFVEELLIKKKQWSTVYIKFIISFLIQAITVIVVAVPEGKWQLMIIYLIHKKNFIQGFFYWLWASEEILGIIESILMTF